MKTIIVGDVHGCYDELIILLDKVRFIPSKDIIIFLGDLIDRGNKSYEVFQYVKSLKEQMGDRCIYICGNHEQMLIDYYNKRSIYWTRNGCEATIYSFENHNDNPKNIVNWLRNNTVFYYQSEKFNCAHASTYYDDITMNDLDVLIWDREVFRYQEYNGKPTFIGHTPLEEPTRSCPGKSGTLLYDISYDLGNGLINIDTGCFYTNILTAAVIQEDGDRFILYKSTEEKMYE